MTKKTEKKTTTKKAVKTEKKTTTKKAAAPKAVKTTAKKAVTKKTAAKGVVNQTPGKLRLKDMDQEQKRAYWRQQYAARKAAKASK